MVNVRRYLLGFVATGVIVFLLAEFLGAPLIAWLNSVKVQVAFLGPIGTVVIDPLILVLQNPAIGALICAVIWPLFLILIALLFIVLVIGLGADAVRAVDSQLR